MEEYEGLLIQMMHLADRVTLARLGLLKEIRVEGNEAKTEAVRFAVGAEDAWEQYPAYFRQTFAYIAASIRDGYAVLDSPAQPVEMG